MSLRTALLPVVDTIKGIASSGTIDIRTYAVVRRVRRWSTGKVRQGEFVDEDLTITPKPKVVERGRLLVVGPLTPFYDNGDKRGGYGPAALNPPPEAGMEFFYVVTGPDGIERPFKLVDLDASRPFAYFIRLESLDRKFPF